MSKRVAETRLTHDNWDDEEVPEEAGVFKMASEDRIKSRNIKVAKRKGLAPTQDGGAFKGFSGFGGNTSKPVSTSLFNFGGEPAKPFMGGNAFGNVNQSTNGSSPKSKGDEKLDNSKYLSKLKALNDSVTKWIKEHVEKNPYCVLTPIFTDYEKHLKDIEQYNVTTPVGSNGSSTKSKSLEKDNTMSTPFFASPKNVTQKQESESEDKEVEKKKVESTLFSFGAGNLSKSGADGKTGGFGGFSGFKSNPASTFPTAGSGFSFAVNKPPAEEKPATTEDEEYVPPKDEVKEVKEDDAFYTKRCKLFYQKEGNWVEKGVGNLHLKPCGEKTQLVIRADTNLGNILLNIMLTASIPFKRQGKNNVTLMCVPNPPIDPKLDDKKPVSMLVRVKTGEDADELLEKIEDNKKE